MTDTHVVSALKDKHIQVASPIESLGEDVGALFFRLFIHNVRKTRR